jgi:hypothetical protein
MVLDAIGSWARSNPQMLQALSGTAGSIGRGMVGHGNDTRDIFRGISGALAQDQVNQKGYLTEMEQAQAAQAELEAEQAKQQETIQWLQQQGFEDLAEYARAGNGGEAWKLALERMNPETAGGDESFFAPIQGFVGDQPTFVQPGNRGTSRVLDLPEGFQPRQRIEKVDLGTEWLVTDTTTGESQRIPKDIRGAEREEAIGGAEGAAIAGASGDIDAGQTALHIIDQIKNHPELEWATGPAAAMGGNNPVLFPQRFGFQRLVEQAKSGAFLTAIQEMRGLGALSNAEGQTATQAVTRLETALRKEDFLQALADYEGIIRRGMERAAARLQAGGGVFGAPTPGANVTSTGLSWSVSP